MTMTTTTDRMVSDYLRDLEDALAGLPPERTMELLADVGEHIAVSRAQLPDDEHAVRNVLQRLGPPDQIAEQARADAGLVGATGPAAQPSRAREIAAIVLLLAGLLLPVIGTLAGLTMVWFSKQWTASEKAVATVLPLLLIPVVGLVLLGPIEAAILGLVFGGMVSGVYLAVRLPKR